LSAEFRYRRADPEIKQCSPFTGAGDVAILFHVEDGAASLNIEGLELPDLAASPKQL
jgi:hypothetical protein